MFKFLAFKIKELMRKTSPSSIKYRKGCWPSKYRQKLDLDKSSFDKSSATWFFKVTCSKEDSEKKGHVVKLSLESPIKVPDELTQESIMDLDVKVSCDCKAFLYYGAHYNAKEKGYLDPQTFQKNKKVVAPQSHKKRNLVCKHIYACLPFSVKFIRWFMTELKVMKDKG